MKIRDLFCREEPVYSFEFFPPKTAQGERSLLETVARLKDLRPSFVSVTYGAGGSTREKTLEIVTQIKREFEIEAMAHLTCVGHDREEIRAILDRLEEGGIENVLPLRGDPPQGAASFVPHRNGFTHAAELVHFIRRQGYSFCLGGAGYPEGHVECRDLDLDVQFLKQKVVAGVDFLITQLFFDNADYFTFVARARRTAIDVPIVPGIMPITNVAQIERITALCGAKIPTPLRERMEAAGEDEEVLHRVGVDYSVEQCRELLAAGAPGIHFYTLNKSPATAAILAELRAQS
jgi:methylenetetrahydrofolate reductase (NADPH)